MGSPPVPSRPDETERSVDGGDAPALERLPARRGRPVAVAVVIASALGLLVWAPWGRDRPSATAVAPSPVPTSARASTPPALTGTATGSSAPRVPAGGKTARYLSITDNEWTVVALLTTDPAPSIEEPATQHVEAPAPSADGPFAVLQQGSSAVADPTEVERRDEPPCAASGASGDGRAVHLPAGRVVYLGVTFPGMDPTASVELSVLGPPTVALHRADPVEVELAGMQPGWRYTVPDSGPGGTILFTADPATRLPTAGYRFELRIPAVAGSRFVYACIGG